MNVKLPILFIMVVVAAVSGWLVTRAARRRMRRALGREPSDLELSSLTSWMRVHEAEKREGIPLPPAPDAAGRENTGRAVEVIATVAEVAEVEEIQKIAEHASTL